MTDKVEYPDLFELGCRALEQFRKEFEAYGIETDPDLQMHKGTGMLCYYDFTDRQIYLSMPDLTGPTGKLQMLMFRQMLAAPDNESLMRFLAIFIPFVVSHEMTHHFRHRYGVFTDDSWFEEQLANKMAAAVNKHRIPPEEKAFALLFLENAMTHLGKQIGVGDDALDSYYDIAHALHTTGELSSDEMINLRMAQGLVSETSSATMILKRSDILPDNVEDRLAARRGLIANFNQQYASDTARYIYYQIGWVYLAMKSEESSYVDEFARRHLGMAKSLLRIRLPEDYQARAIYAFFKAHQQAKPASDTISRFFYKRYRTFLLDYLKKNHEKVLKGVGDPEDLDLDFLSIWDDRLADPINFMVSLVPAFMREIFPNRIAAPGVLDEFQLPEDLPSHADRDIWAALQGELPVTVSNTLRIFEQFDTLEIFRPLPPETIIEIAGKTYRVMYQAGETLVWEGDRNNDVYILTEGCLEAFVQGAGIHSEIFPGEIFGEIAWLTKGTRAATVRAKTPAVCLVIKENDLRLLGYQNPSILLAIAGRTAQRFRELQRL